jgi:hypothetical protein
MKFVTIAVAAFSLALLTACDRGEQRPKTSTPASPASGSSAAPASPTPSSVNSGKTEQNPVQGQVDPKQGAQHKDFKTDGK